MVNGGWWDALPQMPQRQTVHFGGWACPGCQRCYSPSVTECPHCQPRFVRGGVVRGPQDGSDSIPAVLHPAEPAGRCPSPRDGGLCGCDDEDDGPGDCLRARCDC